MRDERGRSPRPSGGEPGGSPSATTGGYDASSIEVLTGLEAVRKRPVMYVGDVSSPTAVAEWVWHAVETTLQLHLDRSARSVSLSVDPTGWVEVADDGPGISAIPGVAFTGRRRSRS
jgi:topoisomerase-4 subunit B